MSTWRNLLTPNVSKYLDSQNRDNSIFHTVETPINGESASFSKEIYEISSRRIETSEFGDGDTKKLKYQEKLDKIQKEILALKKQSNTFSSKDSASSKLHTFTNKENDSLQLESAEKNDFNNDNFKNEFNDKLFLKKTNGKINYTNNDEDHTNKKSRKCT